MEEEPAITLGQALKASDLVGSGGEAKVLIQAGEVLVNGEVEIRRGRKLAPGDVVEVGDERLEATSEDEFLISFNPGYLLDGVSAIDTEKVVFKFNEPLKPGLIVPGTNGEESDFLYLIMPMRDPSRG